MINAECSPEVASLARDAQVGEVVGDTLEGGQQVLTSVGAVEMVGVRRTRFEEGERRGVAGKIEADDKQFDVVAGLDVGAQRLGLRLRRSMR